MSNEPGSPVYDASDLVVPAAENKAVFITTRTLSTLQQRGECPDNSNITKNRCHTDADCTKTATENGVLYVDFSFTFSFIDSPVPTNVTVMVLDSVLLEVGALLRIQPDPTPNIVTLKIGPYLCVLRFIYFK